MTKLKTTKQQQTRLADALISAREAAGLSQEALCRKLGLSQTIINKIENGRREVGFFEFYTIVEAMDQDPVKLAREIWKGDL